ncbi:MAG: hypothetical protein J6W40_00620 [Alphaproteobacteria bacterium]|nr:hypothetical protein [Alphaproteobacteria bacterium]
MKKLLMVILAFVGITSTALAEPKVYESETDSSIVCARVDIKNEVSDKLEKNFNGDLFARIYFDTNKAEPYEGCEKRYKEIAENLSKRKDEIEQVVFIGMASRVGDVDHNTNLAMDRADYVWSVFEGSNWGDAEDAFLKIGEEYVAGSADAFGDDDKNDPEHRSVDIYVLYRLPVCTQDTADYIANIKEKLQDFTGPDKTTIDDTIAKLEELCKGKVLYASGAEEFNKNFALLVNLVAKVYEENKDVPVTDDDVKQGKVKIAYQNLNTLRGRLGLKRSVWRNREGKFNTARLASDSIAGVVLGTAGGLITSHLVKKNQVKKGFEDIQCTIGGQKVAEWGDEFTVGIR